MNIVDLSAEDLEPGVSRHYASGQAVTVRLTKCRQCPVGFFAYMVRAKIDDIPAEIEFSASVLQSSVPTLDDKIEKLKQMRHEGVRRVLELASVLSDDDGIPFED